MKCPGLATHTLAGLCALWLPSAASSFGTLHKPAKPHPPPQTTCTALEQPPVQASTHLLHSAEAAFDLALARGMPRAGHSHTDRALCAVVFECCLLYKSSQTGKLQPPQTTRPALPQPPVQAPSHLLHTAEAAFDLAVPHGMPRACHSRTGSALCAVVTECCLLLWKFPQTGKTATPTNHLYSTPAAAPSAGPTSPATQCRGCI